MADRREEASDERVACSSDGADVALMTHENVCLYAVAERIGECERSRCCGAHLDRGVSFVSRDVECGDRRRLRSSASRPVFLASR